MTLADGRNHLWLRNFNPEPGPIYTGPAAKTTGGSALDRDLSMRSIPDGAEDDSMVSDQADTDHDSPLSHPVAGRLRRRRQIIEEAAETGASIPQPSQEMIRHAAKEDAKYYAGTRHSRPKKRKANTDSDSPLTSTPEEEEDEDEAVADENMADVAPSLIKTRAKRAKARADSDIEMGNAKASRAKRGGRGGGRGTTRGRQARNELSEISEDEEETKPRRSSRLSQPPQKPPSAR